jgi:hypothetical protein
MEGSEEQGVKQGAKQMGMEGNH